MYYKSLINSLSKILYSEDNKPFIEIQNTHPHKLHTQLRPTKVTKCILHLPTHSLNIMVPCVLYARLSAFILVSNFLLC